MVLQIKDIDPEKVEHLKENLNNHIWIDQQGYETNVYEMSHSQRVDIYNRIITGSVNILYLNQWKHIFLNSLSMPLV